MASPEVLKKLLEEFSEKEALVREEIQVVLDEIAQLEAKMQLCHTRLSTIGGDRAKVLAMRQRYLEKKFDVIAAGKPVTAANPPVPEAASFSRAPEVAAPLTRAERAATLAQLRPGRASAQPAASAAPPNPPFGAAPALDRPPASAPVPSAPTTSVPVAPPLKASPFLPPSAQASAAPPLPGAAYAQPSTEQELPPEAVGAVQGYPAPSTNPLVELRKRFGISSILGSRKTAEAQQTAAPPPPPWAQPSTDEETGGFPAIAPTQQPSQSDPPGNNAAPGVPPSNEATADGASGYVDIESAEEPGDDQDDTVKRINDTLRGLFR